MKKFLDHVKNNIISLIVTALALMFTVGIMTVFAACGPKEDGTWMRCHNVQIYLGICGVAMTVLAVAAFISRPKLLRIALYALITGGSVVAFLLPEIIMPMCMLHTMRCYAVMEPFDRVMTALIAVVSIIGIIRTIIRKDRKGEA